MRRRRWKQVGGGAAAPPASLVSIEVTPVDPVIALGTTAQLKATGIYSDNTKRDLTSSVEWDSTDDSVAAVHSGLAMSIAQGHATIKAASGSITGSTNTLTVTSAALVSIHVTPVNPNAALGTSTQFTATGIFSDDSAQDLTSQVTWSSSTGPIASVSNAAGSRGLATSSEMGSTTHLRDTGQRNRQHGPHGDLGCPRLHPGHADEPGHCKRDDPAVCCNGYLFRSFHPGPDAGR